MRHQNGWGINTSNISENSSAMSLCCLYSLLRRMTLNGNIVWSHGRIIINSFIKKWSIIFNVRNIKEFYIHNNGMLRMCRFIFYKSTVKSRRLDWTNPWTYKHGRIMAISHSFLMCLKRCTYTKCLHFVYAQSVQYKAGILSKIPGIMVCFLLSLI